MAVAVEADNLVVDLAANKQANCALADSRQHRTDNFYPETEGRKNQ